jgi:pimeloyl-ACP methyl ester carboxylesterase
MYRIAACEHGTAFDRTTTHLPNEMKKPMVSFLSIALLLYLALCLLLFLFQEKMMFYPSGTPAGAAQAYRQDVFSFTADGADLHGWLFNRGQERLIIYYGGNAEELSGTLPEFSGFSDWSVLMMNYRGFGGSGGRPGQKALQRDALALFDHVTRTMGIKPQQVVLFGRSLGSGVAVYVAAHRPVAGVILVTPFDSLAAVAAGHYPLFPVRRLIRHPFDSAALAQSIRTPCLMLIAGRDAVVPPPRAHALAAVWGGPVQAEVLPSADHNDIHLHPVYRQHIDAFLISHL